MKKLKLVAATLLVGLSFTAQAKNFSLRMGGGHTTGVTYVQVYDTFFADEVSKRVAERTDHKVRFIKAWGGSVARVDGTIEAVQSGTLDIGLVPIGFEQSRAGLLNYSAYLPFTSSDPVVQQKVSNRMLKEVPALQESMAQYKNHVLSATVSEAYGIASTFDWNDIESLQGKRIAMAATNAPLLIPVGGVPVTLGIGDHYQALQTGLADGSLFYISAMETFKLSEPAKYFNTTGLGSLSTLVAFMNTDTRAKLPEEVVEIIDEVALEASMVIAERNKQRDTEFREQITQQGIKVNDLPLEEQQKWAEKLKHVPINAAKELNEKGYPATEVLKTYIQFLEEEGYTFPIDYASML